MPLTVVTGSLWASATKGAVGFKTPAPARAATRKTTTTGTVTRPFLITPLIYSTIETLVTPPGTEPTEEPPVMRTPMPVSLVTSPPSIVTPGGRAKISPTSIGEVPPPTVTGDPR